MMWTVMIQFSTSDTNFLLVAQGKSPYCMYSYTVSTDNNPRNVWVKQGWCSGESAHLPMCPAFGSWTWCHIWVQFVVGTLLCSKR